MFRRCLAHTWVVCWLCFGGVCVCLVFSDLVVLVVYFFVLAVVC